MRRSFEVLIALTLTLILILSGCGFVSIPFDNNRDYETVTPQETEDTYEYPKDTAVKPAGNNSYYTEASDFSSGYAWVRISEFDNNGNWVSSKRSCIDTKGNIIFELPKVYTKTEHYKAFTATKFVNGVAIVNNEALINTDGEVLWSIDGDGWRQADEMFGMGKTKSIGVTDGGCFNGYAFVYLEIETQAGSELYYGVLDSEGKWNIRPDEKLKKIFYAGDGIYEVIVTNGAGQYDNHQYYNASKNKISIDADEINKWRMNYRFKEHNELLYDKELKAFYDKFGNIRIDMSKYILINDPSFYEGYCVLDFINEQGTACFTVLDEKGVQLFSPKIYIQHDKIVSHGLLKITDDDGYIMYLNMKGEVDVGPISQDNAYTFFDGRCRVSEENTAIGQTIYYYIDTDGKRAF